MASTPRHIKRVSFSSPGGRERAAAPPTYRRVAMSTSPYPVEPEMVESLKIKCHEVMMEDLPPSLPPPSPPPAPGSQQLRTAEAESKAALAKADAQAKLRRAEELENQLKHLARSAVEARAAATAAQLKAETTARAVHYAASITPYAAEGGTLVLEQGEAAVQLLCDKLSMPLEALREATALRASGLGLGLSGARGLSALLAGQSMKHLEVLVLSSNGLGDLGVAAVADGLNAAA